MAKIKRPIVILIAIIVAITACVGIVGIVHCNKYKITFELNDTLPDGNGKKAKVILLGGQSNASGCSLDEYLKNNVSSEKYAEYQSGYNNVYINYLSGSNTSKAFVKCATLQGELAGGFGPELGLAEKLNEMYPNELFFIIKCAWGGTNLYEEWLSPSSSGKTGKLYKQFVAFVSQSLEYLQSKNYDIEVEGMCWMQGESDSLDRDTAIEYESNLSNFINDIRDKFKGYSSSNGIAFIDAKIAASFFWTHYELVNQSKANVENLSPLNVLIDTISEGLTVTEEPQPTPDIAHYDSLSEIKLGNLFAEKISLYF